MEVIERPDIECVARVSNQLGETPLWCEREQKLWWLDIEQPTLFALTPSSGELEKYERNCMFLGSQALTRSGRHLLAEDLTLSLTGTPDGDGIPLAEVEPGLDNRLNDGRVDAQGRLWIGTMDNQLHRPNGNLYRVDPDGTVTTIMDGVIVSNGIAFSPDGKLVYFTDTRRHLSFVLMIDPADGVVTDTKIFADYSGTGERPDGACVDVDGCLWAAFFAGGKIVRYAPDGRIDLEIPLPATNPTCLCFGGPDFKTLYVTTAFKFLDDAQRAAEPLAGALLAIHGVGQGVPENRFDV
ncbi:SMP-30/gluconolactonase/LRE family protein [Roseibium sp.]|uniref:SMP-30/gluconolactonase/LRE family protein n=1 Tax=Roseibium sp. TaxID=1936156 RepID=UPI003A97A7CC